MGDTKQDKLHVYCFCGERVMSPPIRSDGSVLEPDPAVCTCGLEIRASIRDGLIDFFAYTEDGDSGECRADWPKWATDAYVEVDRG